MVSLRREMLNLGRVGAAKIDDSETMDDIGPALFMKRAVSTQRRWRLQTAIDPASEMPSFRWRKVRRPAR